MSTKKTKSEKPKKQVSLETYNELTKELRDKLEGLKNVKRPEINNPIIDDSDLATLDMLLISAFYTIEEYAANLRSLDRRRLNGIGNKTMGFLENAYDFAMENPFFLPQFLSEERFTRDYDYFKSVRALLELTDQIRELMWNITIQAADVAFTDALEFYNTVKEAGKRRVDGAETIYRKLEPFFHRNRPLSAEPTKKQEERDIKALLCGKRDGRIVIENVAPKVIAGTHKIIDEKFADSAVIHETKDAEIKE
jgi:hypothetical protein